MMTDYTVARFLFTIADQYSARRMGQLVALAAPLRGVSDAQGSGVPILKVSYRVAADILDKGAGYINALCGLQVREKAVYLGTVWHEKGDTQKPLSASALRAIDRNSYVRGIYDLSLDWHNVDLDNRLRLIRHALTHRYLPIHLEPPGEDTRSDRDLAAQEMKALTLFALKTARAVVFHCVGATEMEDRIRAESPSGVRCPSNSIETPGLQATSPDPSDAYSPPS
jgi:hypothetical protein